MDTKDAADLIRKYYESRSYSFDDLKKEGGPAYPTLADLLAPNIGLDPARLQSEVLDCGLVPPASKPEFVRSYLEAVQRAASDLLVRVSPAELRIDKLRRDAKIEYDQQTNRMLVTLPAEKIFSLFHRAQRGVDPRPAPATTTPVCLARSNVRESVVSISETAAFRRFRALTERVASLRDEKSLELGVLREMGEFFRLRTSGAASEPRVDVSGLPDEEEIRTLLLCLDNIPELTDLETQISLPFEPGLDRRPQIAEQMLTTARLALDTGSALLEEIARLILLIDWSGVRSLLSEDEIPEGGGSIRV